MEIAIKVPKYMNLLLKIVVFDCDGEHVWMLSCKIWVQVIVKMIHFVW